MGVFKWVSRVLGLKWTVVLLSASAASAAEFSPAPDLGAGVLLVARPGLPDPRFAETVILLIDYGDRGAMGLVINRPSSHRLAEALPEVEGLTDRPDPIFLGGPVEPRRLGILLRSDLPPEQSHHVVDDIYFTVHRRILAAAIGRQDQTFHAFAGYAGWASGQLDGELARGDWRLAHADAEIIFEQAAEAIWPELIRLTEGTWVNNTPGRVESNAARPQSAQAQTVI